MYGRNCELNFKLKKVFEMFIPFFILLVISHASKINVPKLLLPYNDVSVNFTLIVDDGCFTWLEISNL